VTESEEVFLSGIPGSNRRHSAWELPNLRFQGVSRGRKMLELFKVRHAALAKNRQILLKITLRLLPRCYPASRVRS
jgi:hypothetical protein